MSEMLDLGPEGRARPRIVQDFASASRGARDMTRLRALLGEAVWALGFHHFLLQGAAGQVWLADLPPVWKVAGIPSSDAVLMTASQSYAPFLWSDISRLIALTPAQSDFMDAAHNAGVGAAVTVPIHRARGSDQGGSYSDFAGCCSFMMKTGMALPLSSLAAAHYVGALAFDAAENLRQAGPADTPHGPHLTPRQRDCVVLVAQGKSDWEIGQLLGISESTVHKHIEDAKRRFAVSTRIQLVVRSLFDARLTFADVMKGEE
ncbi:MAG TPA: LuxR C-terminal-related transcriptional regulator [Rhizomicrobium sp.]|nr:LuxR C-terminal-related transcriptional regulator [Rhizomicrobium sp.]